MNITKHLKLYADLKPITMTNKSDLRTLTFCNKYYITVLDSNKRAHRLRYPLVLDVLDLPTTTDTEVLYTIEIPESALTFLADLEHNFLKYSGEGHRYVMDLVVSHKEENLALQNNPELRELRAQYDTYLRLVAQNPSKLKSFTNQ
jgi:hypothetical protein